MVLGIALPPGDSHHHHTGKEPRPAWQQHAHHQPCRDIGPATSCLLGYSLSLAHDREVGVLQRLRLTPVATWTIVGSRWFRWESR